LGIDKMNGPRQILDLLIKRLDGTSIKAKIMARVDTAIEMQYLKQGGILNYVINQLIG
jgi:aconitate hydratase